MSDRKKRFISAFNFVMEYYGCTREEAIYEKKRALADPYAAEQCFLDFYNRHIIDKNNIGQKLTRSCQIGDKKSF